jgi:hypothetical protein
VNSQMLLPALFAIALTVSCFAQPVRTLRQVDTSDQSLHVQVEGSFDHSVLTDPKRRVNLITDTGAEKTFPGCFRFDMPEQFGIPDSLDYAGFRIYGPLPGRYKLVMRATKTAEIGISVSAQWQGGGAADAGGGRASAGDEVVCYVTMRPEKGSGVGAFTVKVEGFRAKGREPKR